MRKEEKNNQKFMHSFEKIKMNLISVKSKYKGWKNVPEKWLKTGKEGSMET